MRPCLSYPDPHVAPRLDGPGACPLCQLDTPGHPRFSAAHHAKWNGLAAAAVALPCVHVGPEAGPKGWHTCEHEDEPLGAITCTCKGCGPRCPGYAAAAAAPPGAVVLNQGAGGLGDGIQGLLVAAGLKHAAPAAHVVYRCGAKALPFARLFHGYDTLRPHDWDKGGSRRLPGPDRQLNAGYPAELKSRGAEPRVARYCRNAGVPAPVIPPLREPERVRELGRRYAGAVVLCPFTAFSDREWPAPHWADLQRLLTAAGYRTVVLGDDARRAAHVPGERLIGAPADVVCGLLLNAACAVGVDSGLAHLAGLLGTPTLALCGPTRGRSVFGCYPSVRPLDGPLGCSGCYWQPPRTDACGPRCPSIAAITPARVLDAVDAVCLPAIAGHRTLVSADRLAAIRKWVLVTNGLAGDLAELGVYRGGSAKVIRHYAAGGTLHLFDTFAGLPANDTDGEHKAGEFACGLDDVRAAVGTEGVAYHPGEFPKTAPAGLRLRFAHVDLDIYESTRAACAWLRKAVVPGGCAVFDDVGWHKTPGVTRALHEAFPAHVERSAENQAVVRF